MDKKPFKTIQGVDVFIDEESGKFTAKINGRLLKNGSLSGIEKAIVKTKNPVKVNFLRENYPGHVRSRESVILFEKRRPRLSSGRLAEIYDGAPYVITEADLLKIDEFKKRNEEIEALDEKLREEWVLFLVTLEEVTPENIEEIRAKQSSGL